MLTKNDQINEMENKIIVNSCVLKSLGKNKNDQFYRRLRYIQTYESSQTHIFFLFSPVHATRFRLDWLGARSNTVLKITSRFFRHSNWLEIHSDSPKIVSAHFVSAPQTTHHREKDIHNLSIHIPLLGLPNERNYVKKNTKKRMLTLHYPPQQLLHFHPGWHPLPPRLGGHTFQQIACICEQSKQTPTHATSLKFTNTYEHCNQPSTKHHRRRGARSRSTGRSTLLVKSLGSPLRNK